MASLERLANRTIKTAPAADDPTLDRPAASETGQAFPTVNAVGLLEAAGAALGICVIPDGGPAALDGSFQNGFHAQPKPSDFVRFEGRGRFQGMKPRAEQDLVSVNVADSRHEALVEKQALEPALSIPNERAELLKLEVERLGAEAGQGRQCVEVIRRHRV